MDEIGLAVPGGAMFRQRTGAERTTEAGTEPLVEGVDDRIVRRYVRVSGHFRTFLPLYVLATVWVLMMALFPTIDRGVEVTGGFDDRGADWDESADGGSGSAGFGGDELTGASPVGSGPGAGAGHGDGAAGPAGSGGNGGDAPTSGSGGAAGAPRAGAPGVMRDGRMCEPGVRQVEGSSYAAPCRPVFQGDNGGQTYRGVTSETIRIVRRNFPDSPNSRAVAAFTQQAGGAPPEVTRAIAEVFIEHFNEAFELYGRRVEFVDYESQHGDATAEAQSRGREGACLDAEQIVQEIGALGVSGGGGGSSTFSECAAQRGLMVFNAANYFPEAFYRRHSPYLWAVTMDCERISYLSAEYIGKRLLGRNARWAGDPLYRARERKFGVYVPNNDAYQYCTDNSQRQLQEQYGAEPSVRYNYTLDVSRFPDEAARAVVQFRREGVTSLVLACDPISVTFLTQSANSQAWRPEWILIGTALTDLENTARLYEQSQVNGSLFGMSQLGDPRRLIGPESEPGRIYHRLTGQQIPSGTDGTYYSLVHLFNLLQEAGPDLRPDNVRRGAFSLPEGGAPEFPAGRWSFSSGPDGSPGGRSHTAMIDAREVYWVGTERGYDGELGNFRMTYDGRRFTNGEWPAEEPTVYPGR